jgi:hypothetical protein
MKTMKRALTIFGITISILLMQGATPAYAFSVDNQTDSGAPGFDPTTPDGDITPSPLPQGDWSCFGATYRCKVSSCRYNYPGLPIGTEVWVTIGYGGIIPYDLIGRWLPVCGTGF